MLVRICFFIKFLCYLLSLCTSDMSYYSFNYCTLSTRPTGIRVLCSRLFLPWVIEICRTRAVEENCERCREVWKHVGTWSEPPASWCQGESTVLRGKRSNQGETEVAHVKFSFSRLLPHVSGSPKEKPQGTLVLWGWARKLRGRQADVWFPKRVWKTFYMFTTVLMGGRRYVSWQSHGGT